MKLSNKALFLIILLFSGMIAALLFYGSIDQDYFSFYYIGQGIVHGASMYRDFSDNKGPLLYVFFAFLNLIFNTHYKIALFFGSTLLDAIAVYFLLRIIKKFYGIVLRKNFLSILIIFLATFLYKHFFISHFGGGIYSESLGMVFLITSFWAYKNNKNFIAGTLFALSVFTRLSFLLFIFLFLFPSVKKKIISQVTSFAKGFFTTAFFIILPFVFTGTIGDLLHNMIFCNIYYGQATQSVKVKSFFITSISDVAIALILLVVFYIVLTYVLRSKNKDKYMLLVLLLCSVLAIHPGGIFYVHHFSQFMLITFISFAILAKNRPKIFSGVVILLTSCILGMYLVYLLKGNHKVPPQPNEITEKQYLEVVPYYPEYYFAYKKISPDRYYQGFFISDYYNTKAFIDVRKHSELKADKLRKTVFMMVMRNDFDKKMVDEYLQKFEKTFRLSKTKSYKDKGMEIDLYESKL